MNKTEVNALKQFFLKLVSIMENKGKNGNYADVLLYKDDSLSISRDNKDINIDNDSDVGVKIRLFDGESFHVYGCSGIDKHLLIKKAEEFGKIRNNGKIKFKFSKINKDFIQKGKKDPNKVDIKEKVDFVNKLQKKTFNAAKAIVNARVMYQEEQEIRLFVNKQRQLFQDINSCFVIVMPFVKGKDDVRYNYKSLLKSGYEVAKIEEKWFKKFIDETLKISKASKIKPGKYTCILSPDLSGLLAHESFGHGMESDTIYKGRAKAEQFFGKRIASNFVNIIDNPAYPEKHGSFFFDDEGELAQPTYLIRNGIVEHPITDLFSSTLLGISRSANARAETYDHKTYARMSNTYFGPGKDKLKDMLKKVKNGLYLHHSSGGMEDPKGWHVQIQGIVGEEIKNGKLTGKFFYEMGMTGYLPTMLGNIKAVSDKLDIPGTGSCGKGHKEWVRVSEGGPHLLIEGIDLS